MEDNVQKKPETPKKPSAQRAVRMRVRTCIH